jgi:hypothetical protein
VLFNVYASLRCCVCQVVLLAIPCNVTADSAAELQIVREELLAWHNSLTSLEVHLQSRHFDGEAGGVSTISTAKGAQRRFELFHHPFENADNDPTSLIRVLNGEGLFLLTPFTRRIEKTGEYAWKAQQTTYMESIGWWAGNVAAIPADGVSWFIPSITSHPNLSLRSLDTRIAQITVGRDTIIVDRAKGVITQRSISIPKLQPTDASHISIEMTDFRQVNGVWLPFRIERRSSHSGIHTLHDVANCEVNRVQQSRFKVVPRPGALIVERDTDRRRALPGGLDCLEKILASVKRNRKDDSYSATLRMTIWSVCVCLGGLPFAFERTVS